MRLGKGAQRPRSEAVCGRAKAAAGERSEPMRLGKGAQRPRSGPRGRYRPSNFGARRSR